MREGDDGHDDQRDNSADARVDGQEHDAGADGGAKQAQRPDGIGFAPAGGLVSAVGATQRRGGWCPPGVGDLRRDDGHGVFDPFDVSPAALRERTGR